MTHPARSTVLLASILVLAAHRSAEAAGARSFKSGPIQVTADGRFVWVANPDNDSVSRIDTATFAVSEFPLPNAAPDAPRGLSVTEDGSEVWVACHDSDRVYVLDGTTGAVRQTIDLPWGSGPYSVALSRDQKRALVTLHRAAALALIDVPTRAVTNILKPVFWSPHGIAWMEDGVSAWVTHLFADGEDPFLTRVDVSGPRPLVTSKIIVKSTNPKQSSKLAAPNNIAEGGYLTFRGHLAELPGVSGKTQVWLPTQYNNINEDIFTADSTVQTTIRHLELATRTIPNTNNDKVILTAIQVHDPNTSGFPFVGPGWDAHVSGPVDIGFSADGKTGYLLCEQSNDLVVVPTTTVNVKPGAAAPLREIPVGERPMGLALSPVADIAYVMNQLGRSVSVVDLGTGTELRRIAVTPATGEPFPPAILRGARLFHSSTDPRISSNQKIACASCHPHGEHDGRIWDLENLPGNHGPRSSMSLLGLSLTHTPGQRDPQYGFGELHRSGDRDEIQDFEWTFQSVMMKGTGFLGALANPEIGPPNAGRDPDLDAIAGYVMSLPPVPRSPFRGPAGALGEAAVRGATFFVGANRAARRADSGCATCHVPETAFVDFKFHDVGQRRAASEKELNARTPVWSVNTPTLAGVWSTPPYDGVATYASTIIDVIQDQAARAKQANPHGTPDGLTGRQIADLAELVQSIDGNTTAAEIRLARDTTPPRVVRVEPASLTAIDAWFSETVNQASVENVANWELVEVGSGPVAVTAAKWDPQNGDRVRLTAQLRADCVPVPYRLRPVGPIADVADWATGGTANLIDLSNAANTHSFTIGSQLTVTLGASGYENLTVPVHDAAMVGPGLSTWGHDSLWLYVPAGGNPPNKGFVRFDWKAPFAAVTGLASSADILDASFSLIGNWGDSQTLTMRRVLQKWSDPTTGNDFNSNPVGGPTWRDHAHPSAPWNLTAAGKTTAGIDGRSVSDYNGLNDLAGRIDATVTLAAINERQTFAAPEITDAYRFWFDNPAVDYGYALQVGAGATQETKFQSWESELHGEGPVLTITYRLPVTPVTPSEVSGLGNGGGTPFLAIKQASDMHLYFEDLGTVAATYNVYEGTIGTWFSHTGTGCNVAAPLVGTRREWTHTPAAGSRYLQITASNACVEGPAAAGWPAALLNCPP